MSGVRTIINKLAILFIAVSLGFFCNCASTGKCAGGDCVNGEGVFISEEGKYEGQFKDNKKQGKGSMKYANSRYEGQWENDMRSGKGTLTWEDGVISMRENGK